MKTINKILIAEDELLIAKVLRMQLENLGFEVSNVVDGEQAKQSILELNPDLIILDNQLKNKTSGIDVGYFIRNSGIETPIIFISGNSYDQTLEQVKYISNTIVLSKPVVFEHLAQIIESYQN